MMTSSVIVMTNEGARPILGLNKSHYLAFFLLRNVSAKALTI